MNEIENVKIRYDEDHRNSDNQEHKTSRTSSCKEQ